MRALISAAAAMAMAGCATTPPVPLDGKHYSPVDANAFTASKPVLIESYGQLSPRQHGELRLPKGKGPFPVAMLVHGGCWAGMGSTANMGPLADWLAANGVASWNIDYRELGSGGGWPGTFQDWASALAALEPLAKRYPLDLGRVGVVGHSAGATPAVWLATGTRGDEILAGELPRVRASVVLDGPTEVTSYAGGIDKEICGKSVIEPLLGGMPDTVRARYDLLDPRKNAMAAKEMVVVVAALPAPGDDVMAAIRAAGVNVQRIDVSNDQHFDLIKPGTPDFNAHAQATLKALRGR